MRLQTALLSLSSLLLLPTATHASPPTCPTPQLSCHTTTPPGAPPPNPCCINTPGGQLLQTQFWDYSPSVGPEKSWTLHGLWPDKCDGSYDANCDAKRAYTNITDIIGAVGKEGEELLKVMQEVWVPDRGSAEVFWEHEWGKHGTCISTLSPSCYTDYVPQEEVVAYFNITVQLYQSLNTYDILSTASILPHPTHRYPLTTIESALSAARNGAKATVSCDHHGALQEVWYYFNVKGSLQTGSWVPSQPDGAKGKCPKFVRYLPKGGGHGVGVGGEKRVWEVEEGKGEGEGEGWDDL